MNWETRWVVVTPLLTFFGGKLLATSYLLWRLTHGDGESRGELDVVTHLGSRPGLSSRRLCVVGAAL